MKDLLKRLNLKVNDFELLQTAFVHKSATNNNDLPSYERLEFLGDSIFNLVVTDYLYRNFDYDEGLMTRKRQFIIKREMAKEFSIKLGLDKFIVLGNGSENLPQSAIDKIVSDVFESFVGAIFLDQGFDVVEQLLIEKVLNDVQWDNIADIDCKSKLQQDIQADSPNPLEYRVLKEDGKANSKWFVIGVYHDGILMGEGSGYTKKEAENQAACDALEKAKIKK